MREGHLDTDDATRAARRAIDRITLADSELRQLGGQFAAPEDLLR